MMNPEIAAPGIAPPPAAPPLWRVIYRAVRGTWFLVLIHVGAVGAVFAGVGWEAWLLFAVLLPVRGLTTTVAYHRYFAHRSFKTSRAFQLFLACLCCSNLQRGPLWWAAMHRQHHRRSDLPGDTHSPVLGGVFWAYCGWMFVPAQQPDWGLVRDLTRYPELVWLERLWLLPALLLAGACWLAAGWGGVCLGFCLTAALALHGASVVNTLGHLVGSRRYQTHDGSRNSLALALITFGDGWHNNHHHYPHSAQAGFFPGEVDGSYAVIRLLERLGLVWGVRGVPAHKLHSPGEAASSAGPTQPQAAEA
jgi:stearoyl-CoA desaturase (delta-9 desaturase)